MTSAEIRQRFLHFFEERDHKVLPSSSLIPFDDPTLLLTNAGMNQFKPYFLGQRPPPIPRATTVQKVFRTADIELVGHDGHHLTFFEMLGNFSFGDYFKEKAIPYAYECLTTVFKLDPNRLWAGIHDDDDESFEIWTSATGIPPERVRRFGDEYNFWAAGPTGPCGPDSEIHYDWGVEYGCGRDDCGPNCPHCDRFLELWNLVFMQWDRDQSGKRTPLKRKGIDTGMGLERLIRVVNGQRGVFETDLLRPLVDYWANEGHKPYGTSPESDVSLRVLADHSKAAAMLISDGLSPSNEGRGYVLRRIVRRAMIHAQEIGAKPAAFLNVPAALEQIPGFVGAYPQVKAKANQIRETFNAEIHRLSLVLGRGTERLNEYLESGSLGPEQVFYLYDTLGFPIDLALDLARDRGINVDPAAVDALMQKQRERSKTSAGMFTGPVARTATTFVGYQHADADTTVSEIFPVSGVPDHADLVLRETPFYAERGGQAADTGWITWSGGEAEVLDVQAQGDAIRHRVRLRGRRPEVGEAVHAEIDRPRREAIARHHSATHLLHRALRQVLGEKAEQAGSAVLPASATFDFRFPRALSADEVVRVEDLLNEKIRADLERRVDELPLKEAIATGAVALFDEKYGEVVRVVSFGDWARELCGGTHVERTGNIGVALISSDKSIGTGVRRIEMRAGQAAIEQVRSAEGVLRGLSDTLKTAPAEMVGRVEGLQAEVRRLQREQQALKQRLAAGGTAAVRQVDINGVSLFLQEVDANERDLLPYIDTLLNRTRSAAVAIVVGGGNFAVKLSGLDGRLNISELIGVLTKAAGGRGGGRGAVGFGGGLDPERLGHGFQSIQAFLRERL